MFNIIVKHYQRHNYFSFIFIQSEFRKLIYKYQILALKNKIMSASKNWCQEEDTIIQELVNKVGTKQWALIANELHKKHGFKLRTGKQCRQRWHNHLDPQINKKPWDKQEENMIFELHKIHGNKWTIIAQNLPGRTDNSIKNHFYSTIRRSLRRINKILGSKNSTQSLKIIKPSTLSLIFSIVTGNQMSISTLNCQQNQAGQNLSSYIDEHCQDLTKNIMEFSNIKPTYGRNRKKMNNILSETDNQKFEEILEKMKIINNLYEKAKHIEKKKRKQYLIGQGKDVGSDSDEISEEKQSQKDQLSSFHDMSIKLESPWQHSSQEKVPQVTRSCRLIKTPKFFQPTSQKKTRQNKIEEMNTNTNQKQESPIKKEEDIVAPLHQAMINTKENLKKSDVGSIQSKIANNQKDKGLLLFSDFIEFQGEIQIKSGLQIQQELEKSGNNQLNCFSPQLFFNSPLGPTPSLNLFRDKTNYTGPSFNNQQLDFLVFSFRKQTEMNLENSEKKPEYNLGFTPKSAFNYYSD